VSKARPKQSHRSRIRSTAGQLANKPTLTLLRVIVPERMRGTAVPMRTEPLSQFQPHPWIIRNIADVSCVHAMLRYDPELIADLRVPYWSATELPGLAANGFEERISGRHDAYCKEKFNQRVEHVFLQCVNHLMSRQ
jgi:hypothetical protein